MNRKLIKISNLYKDYNSNKTEIIILNKIDFEITSGQIISIIGPSGSGKSTFLNIIGLLDSSYKGDYEFLSKNIQLLSLYQKNILRNKSIGFIHQFFHLIPELNILENISLPSMIRNNEYVNSYNKAKKIIKKFGLIERIYSKPNDLSGGEQQRVAIARALINNPELIIADEITGNLDENTADKVFEFFLSEIKSNNKTLIYVTHNIEEVTRLADKA